MAGKTHKRLGEDVVKDAFGASLYSQGRGYYVTLELFAILWGTNELDGSLLAPNLSTLRYQRRSHDLARRLMAGSQLDQTDLAYFDDSVDTAEAIASLLQSLRVPLPFSRKMPNWLGQHLYPFVGQLIHYDAANKRGAKQVPAVERYLYRGAGGLAHEILRNDHDPARLDSTRLAIGGLIADSDSPLGRLSGALAAAAKAEDKILERDSVLDSAALVDSEWFEILRDGVNSIVTRDTVRSRKIEHLMHFVPYCIARFQLDGSCEYLGRDLPLLSVDVGSGKQIREISRAQLNRHRGLIEESLLERAKQRAAVLETEGTEASLALADGYRKLVEQKQQEWRRGSAGFYTATLATISGLNSNVGNRHYTLGLPLLEALAAGLIRGSEAVEFEDFCVELLGKRLRLVIDNKTASRAGLLDSVDKTAFMHNEQGLSDDLEALGLLVQYSDTTKLVSVR